MIEWLNSAVYYDALSIDCRINSFLDQVDVGEVYVRGEIEAFSCTFGNELVVGALAAHLLLYISLPCRFEHGVLSLQASWQAWIRN